jgi:hypothetical protein
MRIRRFIMFGVGGIVALLALSWVAIYVYIHVFKEDPPPPLSFDTLDAATTTVAAVAQSGCSPLTFESGRAVLTVADPAKASRALEVTSQAMSGELTICNGLATSGTIDIDVSTAVAATGEADTAAGRTALQADEFPVVSITLNGADPATVLVAGDERQVPVVVSIDGTAVSVAATL